MKKILTRCFGIVLFITVIWSMLNLMGTAIGNTLFTIFGVICVVVASLSIIAIWGSCIAVLTGIVIATIKTGAGLGTMFQKLVDKVVKPNN